MNSAIHKHDKNHGQTPKAAESVSHPLLPWERYIDHSTLLLLLLALLGFSLHKIITWDVWWQLKTGEWVLSHGWPTNDPFSYWVPNRPWIELRWLYCVAIYLLKHSFGLNSLIIVKTLLLFLTFAGLWRLRLNGPRWVVHLAIASSMTLASFRFMVRPELVTFLLLVLFLLCLERYKLGGHYIWILVLPVMQIVWVNAHTLFVLGPVVLWIFVFCEWLQRWLHMSFSFGNSRPLPLERYRAVLVIAVLTTACCLLNPYFAKGAIFPLHLLGEISSLEPLKEFGISLKEIIYEFRSPFQIAGFNSIFLSYLWVIGLGAASFFLNYRRLVLSRLGLWIAFLSLSFLAKRNLAIFALVSAYAIILNLSESFDIKRKQQSVRVLSWCFRMVVMLFLIVLIPAVVTNAFSRFEQRDNRFGLGISELRYPIAALAFVESHGLPRPVICNLGDGGYTLYEGGEKSVFFDGRLEVYGAKNVLEGSRLFDSGYGWERTTRSLGINTAIIRHRQAVLLQLLESSPSWAPVYYDHLYIVYVRVTNDTNDLINHLNIDWQDPIQPSRPALPSDATASQWPGNWWPTVSDHQIPLRLGRLFLNMGNLEEAQKLYEKAHALHASAETILYLGMMYQAKGHSKKADPLIAQVRESEWKKPDTYALQGRIRELAGDLQAALLSYQEALRLADTCETINKLHYYQFVTRLALQLNETELAINNLTRTTKAYPDHHLAWNQLGKLYMKTGSFQKALEAFARSLKLQSDQVSILFLSGVVHARLGELHDARKSFQQALKLQPEYPPALRELDRLEQLKLNGSESQPESAIRFDE